MEKPNKDLEKKAKEIMKTIKKAVQEVINPQWWVNIHFLKLFGDGKPHQWSQVCKAYGLSGVAASKRLKTLLKAGVLQRTVDTTAFPPRTYYKLADGPAKDYFRNVGEIIRLSDEIAETMISVALLSRMLGSQATMLKEMDQFLDVLKNAVYSGVASSLPFVTVPPEPSLLTFMAAYQAYCLLLLQLTVSVALKILPPADEHMQKAYGGIEQKLISMRDLIMQILTTK